MNKTGFNHGISLNFALFYVLFEKNFFLWSFVFSDDKEFIS